MICPDCGRLEQECGKHLTTPSVENSLEACLRLTVARLRAELAEARLERDDWRGSYELVRGKYVEASPALARAEAALTAARAALAEKDAALRKIIDWRQSQPGNHSHRMRDIARCALSEKAAKEET